MIMVESPFTVVSDHQIGCSMDVFLGSRNLSLIVGDYANVLGVHMDRVALIVLDDAPITALLGFPLEVLSKLS
jgi:hypothetical protein